MPENGSNPGDSPNKTASRNDGSTPNRRRVLKQIGAVSLGAAGIAGTASAADSDSSVDNNDLSTYSGGTSIRTDFRHIQKVDEYYNGDDIVTVQLTFVVTAPETIDPTYEDILTIYWENDSWTLHNADGYEPVFGGKLYFEDELNNGMNELEGSDTENDVARDDVDVGLSNFDRWSVRFDTGQVRTYNCTNGWYCNYEDSPYGATRAAYHAKIHLLNQDSDSSPGHIRFKAGHVPTTDFDLFDHINLQAGVVSFDGDGVAWTEQKYTTSGEAYCCGKDGEVID